MQELTQPDSEILKELIRYKMPFGKYKDWIIADLPVSYLEWFQSQGFPAGKLGMLLSTMFEIRTNGLDFLIQGLRKLPKS